MSTIVVLKEADTLILATDSRCMRGDNSSVVTDALRKIFEIGLGTFIATSGQLWACNFQSRRARELAGELGTTDIQVIGAALERESLPCLMELVERLRLEPDEVTKQTVSGASLLHVAVLAGRNGSGQLGYVVHWYRVLPTGAIGCRTETYFDEARSLTASSSTPVPVFAKMLSRLGQDTATWSDPLEQVAARFLDEIRQSTPTAGGPTQLVRLDDTGARWISRPPRAAISLTRSLPTVNIVAPPLSVAPAISGGSIVGSQITSTLNGVTIEANGTYDATIGQNTGLRVKSAASPNYRVVVVPGGVWMMDPSGVVRVQILGDGNIFLHDAAGLTRVVLDPYNGQLLMSDSSGNTRVQMDTFSGAGHIAVNGTGASITINGRSL